MLVLDESLSASLLTIAASEKLITHTKGPAELYRDPTTSRFLAKGADTKLHQQALFDLLLHYPAILSPCDNLDYSGLKRLGLVEGELSSFEQRNAYQQMREAPEVAFGVQEFIVADIAKEHTGLNSDEVVAKYLCLSASKGHDVHNQMNSALYMLFDTYDEYVNGITNLFGDHTLTLHARDGFSIPGCEFGAALAADANREDFEAFKAYEKNRAFMNAFHTSATRWLALTNFSRTQGAVLSAKIPANLLAPRKPLTAGSLEKQLRLRADQGSTHVAVCIWMEEVLSAPRLKSIEDVLRLREDKRIDAFRTAMVDWTESLAGGSPVEEARLRKLVRTANKEVAKLKGIDRMSTFFTFASIPLDMLLGQHPLTSLPVTGFVGAAVLLATNIQKKPLDWVMFGGS